jgi:hypothetical protein
MPEWTLTTTCPQPKSQPRFSTAILGFEGQKRGIDLQIAELRAMLSGPAHEATIAEPAKRPSWKMSAAARKGIGDAQRKRWAAAKK